MSYTFLRERGEESSAGTFSDMSACAPSRWMNTLAACCSNDSATDSCRGFPSGTTCGRSTGYRGADGSMSSAEDSPARTFPRPDAGPGSTGSGADCGASLRGLLARFDRDSSTWRTPQCSLLAGLDVFSETWPRWGTMRNGECWERATPALRTSGTASGSWHTPEYVAAQRAKGNGCSNLNDAVALPHLFPTPTAACATGGQTSRSGERKGELLLAGAVRTFPTPRCEDSQCAGGHRGKDDTLYGAVCRPKQFPTPCASEARQGYQNRHNGKSVTQESLSTVVQGGPADQVGGSLNPEWVEGYLMGWPYGWTSLEPMPRSQWDAWLASQPVDGRWHAEPADVPRVAKGVPNRVARLKSIGNGQVPQCAAMAWAVLRARIMEAFPPRG